MIKIKQSGAKWCKRNVKHWGVLHDVNKTLKIKLRGYKENLKQMSKRLRQRYYNYYIEHTYIVKIIE